MKTLSSLGLSLMLAGLVATALAVALVPAVTGTRAVTIDRASMQAVLPVGSLAYVTQQDRYGIHDVVTYQWNGKTVTHEIVAIHPNPQTAALDGTWFRTQGTSNAEVDENPLNREDILGKVVYHTPYVGTALKVLGTPVVQVFLALLALGLYLLSSAKKKGNNPHDRQQDPERLEPPRPEDRAEPGHGRQGGLASHQYRSDGSS